AFDRKGDVQFNQPFVNGKYAFVFNGLLQGVTLPAPGANGAQRIWNLLQGLLKRFEPQQALQKTKEILQKHARDLTAFNVGLCDLRGIHAICHYNAHPWYYQLHETSAPTYDIICSESLRF